MHNIINLRITNFFYIYVFFQLMNALTTIRSVNKTDATTLLSTFGTLSDLVQAPSNILALCPGVGVQKAERIHKTLHEQFLRPPKSIK